MQRQNPHRRQQMPINESQISKEEFAEWENSGVTKFVLELIKEQERMATEYLKNGGTIGPDAGFTTDRVVGRIEGWNFILNIQYEDENSYDY